MPVPVFWPGPTAWQMVALEHAMAVSCSVADTTWAPVGVAAKAAEVVNPKGINIAAHRKIVAPRRPSPAAATPLSRRARPGPAGEPLP
jgi:hypothetical protein